MKIEIEVTQADIDKGIPNAVMSCPIAQAVKRQGYINPRVDGETIRFYCAKTERGFLGNCTKRVERWIDRFDNHKPSVKPFKFTLNCDRLG